MIFIVNKWRMDPTLNTLTHSETGEVRRLGEYHFILLETLVKNADMALSRSFLSAEVWKNRVVGANSLPTAIHALRAAIDDDGKQQEIIKTIPKKGYYFNKSYLTIEESTENPEPISDDALESKAYSLVEHEDITAVAVETSTAINNHEAEEVIKPEPVAIADVNDRQHKRKKQTRWIITLAVFITAFILLTFILFLQKNTPPEASDTPVLVKEEVKNADRITVYHLYYQGINKDPNNSLDHHLASAIPEINDLLARHQASMTAYYKVSFNKVSFSLLFTNQCKHTQQLMINVENVQERDTQLNDILYKESENILNAMPKC